MKHTLQLFLCLIMIIWMTGCCSSRPPTPVANPAPLGTTSLAPKSIANRAMTSLLIASPLATAGQVAVFVATPSDSPTYPEIMAAMQHLAQTIATESRFTLVSRQTDADFVLTSTLQEEPPQLRLHLVDHQGATTGWTFRQPLPLR